MVQLPVDCCFDNGAKDCSILTSKKCGKCRFYKQQEELINGRAKALARILTLPNANDLLMKYHLTTLEGVKKSE